MFKIIFIMAIQSKEASLNMKNMLIDMLVGSTKKKMISSTILLIIVFLIHVRMKQSSRKEIKLNLKDKDKRKVYQSYM
jgi:hypothetical protein